MNDIVQHSGSEVAVGSETNSRDVLAMVLAAARDPNIDAANVKTMADLAMQMEDREILRQFRRDKAAALIAMPSIRRDGRIVIPAKGNEPERVQGRFVKYESLQAVIDPILASHNLILTHEVDSVGEKITVRPILTHAVNGYEEKGGAMPIPLDTSGGKNNTQGAGSSVSYGMRYTACAMLHIRIHGVDDDGTGRGQSEDGPESRYTQAQHDLIADGRSAAMQGVDAYGAWFREQSAAIRGWLTVEGEHDKFKAAAERV